MAKIKKLSELALFQCMPNTKIPATKNGFKDANMDFDVKSYLEKGYNIGLACCQSGLIVLDADVDESRDLNGLKTITEFEMQLGTLPRTLTVQTPRNGRHFIFSSRGIDNPVGKIGKDIDVKFNGYVVFPPSKIDGKSYKIVDGIDENGDFIIADLPEKWITYLNKKNKGIPCSSYNNRTQIKRHPDYKINQIIDNCKFLQFCRDNAYCLDEPLWFSMISILSSVNNSDTLIHWLSKPYPNYTYKETQQKINRAKKYGRPQTCKYISENYPLICKGCISSCQRGDL